MRWLADLLVPPGCLACGAPGRALCAACRAGVAREGRACPRCALPQHGGRACPAAGAAFAAAWAPALHEGPARELVHALKFRGAIPVAWLMAEWLADCPLLVEGAVLVPVPAVAARRRRRGFDPAALIARSLGRRAGIPVARVLRVHGRPAPQVGAGARARRAAALDVRCARRPPAHAILVDDVHTTGATLDACARALRAGGAERVDAITFTRTP